MQQKLSHEIDNYPEPDDVGTITVTTRIFGQDDNSTFTTLSLAREFIENDECNSKEDLNYFLLEAEINEDVIYNVIQELIVYVDEVTCSASSDYSPGSIQFRPASKLAVKSLARKTYNKKIEKEKKKMISFEECRICLKEFSNGGMVVTLPCGHEFDDECIVKWFETSHVCPLCRLELPCQEDEI
ncbi:hypothetical protein Bca52824_031893 [Brassica carinata]|uniref:RING-type domain-containing protein n=1 Tax=Brassica carinata TaxID=52824 RepID=A0A8X7V5S8_BRACI|nr:hypothetical protein Bca52824_031893 [Brassica carinata]